MPDTLRRALRACSPLIAVQLFLLALNLIVSPGTLWALIPIAAIGIPEFIIVSQMLLREPSADAKREAAQARQRASDAAEADTPAASTDKLLDQQLAQVKTYRQGLDNLVRRAGTPQRQARLRELSTQFDGWARSVEQMAQRIKTFHHNEAIQQDLRAVPEYIKNLEAQLGLEQDPQVRAQISKTLDTRRNQQASLQKLRATMRQADIQLENTVAALGTIYSQALAGQSTNDIADYRDLAADVNEQVQVLQDQLDTLEEVKLGQATRNLGGNL